MLSSLPDEEVRKLHPAHSQASIKALLPRLKYFKNGTCIVHHIFGGEVGAENAWMFACVLGITCVPASLRCVLLASGPCMVHCTALCTSTAGALVGVGKPMSSS
jgi:hypothetical protein